MTIEERLEGKIKTIVEFSNNHQGTKPSPECRDAINDLVALESISSTQMCSRVALALEDIHSTGGAGMVALWLGACVEQGADPSLSLQPILDAFLRFTNQIETDEETLDADLVIGLEFFGPSLVAHLSRDKQGLRSAQQNPDLLAELERVEWSSVGITWVLELLHKVSGSLIVLHGEHKADVKVEYRNISNCFHLFTLLQAVLVDIMPDGKALDPIVVAVARGELAQECNDHTWWHYGQPLATQPDIVSSIFCEISPLGIGTIAGEQIMLLWSPILKNRSWHSMLSHIQRLHQPN